MEFTDLGEAFSEKALTTAHEEIIQGYRIVDLKNFRGKDMEVKIKFPNVEVDSDASKIYSKTMSELLMGDQQVITKIEMERKLTQRGIWGKEQEDEIEAIDDRMIDLMREGQEMHSKNTVDPVRLEILKKEYLELKAKKNSMITKRENFMSSTVEGMSDISALEYKLFMCCEDMDGKRLWNTYDDFRKEYNRFAVVDLLQKAMIFWSGLPQGVLGMLPKEFVFGEQSSEPSQESPSGSSVLA